MEKMNLNPNLNQKSIDRIYRTVYRHSYVTHQWWVSMLFAGWSGGLYVTDDYGNMVKV